MSDPVDTTAIYTMFATISDIFRPVLDAAVGYRAQCEAAGFSPTAAEAMAEEFHRLSLTWMFDQFRQAGKA